MNYPGDTQHRKQIGNDMAFGRAYRNGARTFQSASGSERSVGVGEVWAFVEIARYRGALAPLQGALMGVVGYLGHRCAQPQAVLSVPVGDARVRCRRAMMARPYRASGIGVPITWAVGPGWYGSRRWRSGTGLGSVEAGVFRQVWAFSLACSKWSGHLVFEGQRPGTIPAWANGPGCRFI